MFIHIVLQNSMLENFPLLNFDKLVKEDNSLSIFNTFFYIYFAIQLIYSL